MPNNNRHTNRRHNNRHTDRRNNGWDDEMRGKRCNVCLPYRDPWIILAMIGSLIAFAFSWTWWLSWIFCLSAMIMFQCMWCCRDTRMGMIRTLAMAVLCAAYNIGIAVFVRSKWDAKFICLPFVMASATREDIMDEFDDDQVIAFMEDPESYMRNVTDLFSDDEEFDDAYYYTYDDVFGAGMGFHRSDLCFEGYYGGIAVLCGTIWMLVAFCACWFVCRGNHATWEDKYSSTTAVAVELGRVPNNAADMETGSPEVAAEEEPPPFVYGTSTDTEAAGYSTDPPPVIVTAAIVEKK